MSLATTFFCPYPCNICVGVLCPIQTWEWVRVPEQTTSYFGHNKISNNLTARHHRHNHVQNYLIIFGKSFLQTDNDNAPINIDKDSSKKPKTSVCSYHVDKEDARMVKNDRFTIVFPLFYMLYGNVMTDTSRVATNKLL